MDPRFPLIVSPLYQDLEWKVHLPGARRIKIVFDPRSRTETNCDWVSITQEVGDVGSSSFGQRHEALRYSARFHGRDGRENFPGFGGRLPLWVDGERFVARFRSDRCSTDWGIRFTAYGILDDEDEADAKSDGAGADKGNSARLYEVSPPGTSSAVALMASGYNTTAGALNAGKIVNLAGRAGTLELDLACWLLEFLSRDASWVPMVAARLCNETALGVMLECLKAFSQRRRLRVLRLVATIVAEARLTPAVPAHPPLIVPPPGSGLAVMPSAEDVGALQRTVLALTEAQRVLEGAAPMMTPYLQALVQCAVLLHAFLVNIVAQAGDMFAANAGNAEVARGERSIRDGHGTREDANSTRSSGPFRNLGIVLGGSPGAAAVRDVATLGAIISDFVQGITPVRLLLEDFLPLLTDACSVTVQSTHPFDRTVTLRSVRVPGAISLQARFDPRTEMGEDDRIVIRHPGLPMRIHPVMATAHMQGFPSPPSPKLEGEFLREREVSTFDGLTKGTNDENLPAISVGDRVERGAGWTFGNEDGADELVPNGMLSPSSRTGIVTALEQWSGREGGGARVRWSKAETKMGMGEVSSDADGDEQVAEGGTVSERSDGVGDGEGGERCFEALYSVQNPAHLRVVKRGGIDRQRRPVFVGGSALEIEAIPAGQCGHEAHGRNGGRISCSYPREHSCAGINEAEQTRTYCLKFDGESTHVDLPTYQGMCLEGDFTLEVWAWLDYGTARNGKAKCVLSRANDYMLNGRLSRGQSPCTEDSLLLSTVVSSPASIPSPADVVHLSPSSPVGPGAGALQDPNTSHTPKSTATPASLAAGLLTTSEETASAIEQGQSPLATSNRSCLIDTEAREGSSPAEVSGVSGRATSSGGGDENNGCDSGGCVDEAVGAAGAPSPSRLAEASSKPDFSGQYHEQEAAVVRDQVRMQARELPATWPWVDGARTRSSTNASLERTGSTGSFAMDESTARVIIQEGTETSGRMASDGEGGGQEGDDGDEDDDDDDDDEEEEFGPLDIDGDVDNEDNLMSQVESYLDAVRNRDEAAKETSTRGVMRVSTSDANVEAGVEDDATDSEPGIGAGPRTVST